MNLVIATTIGRSRLLTEAYAAEMEVRQPVEPIH